MKMTMKRLGCLVLALTMILSLAACGKGSDSGSGSGSSKPEATATPEFVYAAEFKTLVENSKEWINARSFDENGMFFTKYEKIGEREHEGKTPRWEGEFDVFGTFLYFWTTTAKRPSWRPTPPCPARWTIRTAATIPPPPTSAACASPMTAL